MCATVLPTNETITLYCHIPYACTVLYMTVLYVCILCMYVCLLCAYVCMYVCMCETVLPTCATQVACRYITDPVLFYRDDVGGYVKMDIRYVLLLKCVHPLELYANKVFWLRFANK